MPREKRTEVVFEHNLTKSNSELIKKLIIKANELGMRGVKVMRIRETRAAGMPKYVISVHSYREGEDDADLQV